MSEENKPAPQQKKPAPQHKPPQKDDTKQSIVEKIFKDSTPQPLLFLVEGIVRAQAPEGAAQQSEQRRLVWALNENEAGDKYTKYFTSMNTAQMTYSVVGAAITKAIS